MNYYADGSYIVYGSRTYVCRDRRWVLFANKPDILSDWQTRRAEVVEGTGNPSTPPTEANQQLMDLGNENQVNLPIRGDAPNEQRIRRETEALARSMAQQQAAETQKRQQEAARALGSAAAINSGQVGSNVGRSDRGDEGSRQAQLSLAACSTGLNSRRPPQPTGKQCLDAEANLKFYRDSKEYLESQCASASEVIQMINQLDTMIQQTVAYRNSICVR